MPEPAQAAPRSSGELKQTWAELAEMIALRRELAEAEIRHDVSLSKRSAIVGLAGFITAMTGLPVAVTAAAAYADARLESFAFPWITVVSGGVLLAVGLLTMLLVWLRFRARFLGLQETISELKEDGVWLREWFAGHADESARAGDRV